MHFFWAPWDPSYSHQLTLWPVLKYSYWKSLPGIPNTHTPHPNTRCMAPWVLMMRCGYSWCSWVIMLHHEYSWCIMGTHDASWALMMHHEYLWCIMGPHLASWALMMYHEYLWCIMSIHLASWVLMMHHEDSWCIMGTHDLMMHHEFSCCIYFGGNRWPPRINLEATGAYKDDFGGSPSSSDYTRNSQIMKIVFWVFPLTVIDEICGIDTESRPGNFPTIGLINREIQAQTKTSL